MLINIIYRYGSELIVIDSYTENNMTANMVPPSPSNSNYWLGLASVDDLRTNTLESAAGALVSQYAGYWDLKQPNPKNGECVDVHVTSETQSWELTTCETLLPFMCKANACPAGKIFTMSNYEYIKIFESYQSNNNIYKCKYCFYTSYLCVIIMKQILRNSIAYECVFVKYIFISNNKSLPSNN